MRLLLLVLWVLLFFKVIDADVNVDVLLLLVAEDLVGLVVVVGGGGCFCLDTTAMYAR